MMKKREFFFFFFFFFFLIFFFFFFFQQGFARLCAERGVEFIGPPASAIDAMGSKSASKRIMSEANVPVVPGYHGEDQSVQRFTAEANRIGYPVLIKAVMGGGGKGMRIAHTDAELKDAMAASSREAVASFGNGALLIEKYVTRPRHIEFQVFGDKHGNVVHLGERDCSVQRRYQKVIEEAPAPGMTPELRNEMGTAAVNAARAVKYVGAGTVEFIFDCDTNKFYFMEMNTRLQVEHPVTECITGQDLVEWQLRVASGDVLPLAQSDIRLGGHAFEARVYAESPRAGFLPHTGHLWHLRPPAESPNVRVDTGVRQGDDVSIYYDPMIAKLIVWDTDRAAALRRLNVALGDYQIGGLPNNIEFLRNVADHPAFVRGQVDTSFIAQYKDQLLPPIEPTPAPVLAAAALFESLVAPQIAAAAAAASTVDASSPWASLHSARFNLERQRTVTLGDKAGGETVQHQLRVREVRGADPSARAVEVALKAGVDEWQSAQLTRVDVLPGGGAAVQVQLGSLRYSATVVPSGTTALHVYFDTKSFDLERPEPSAAFGLMDESASAGALTPPMPGKIVAVVAKVGDTVKKGDSIMIMEAMKMEHVIRAPYDGVVEAINFGVEALVNEKVVLAVVTGAGQADDKKKATKKK
jgi:3-methylcrotonyl-CoA carboxylase alpha subunit